MQLYTLGITFGGIPRFRPLPLPDARRLVAGPECNRSNFPAKITPISLTQKGIADGSRGWQNMVAKIVRYKRTLHTSHRGLARFRAQAVDIDYRLKHCNEGGVVHYPLYRQGDLIAMPSSLILVEL